MPKSLPVLILIPLLFGAVAPVAAQRPAAAAAANTPYARVQPAGPAGAASFVIEALGGTAGSVAGLGFVALLDDCDVEDIGCLIGTVSLTTALGSAAGAWIAGRAARTRPSAAGAAVGALVGVAAGAGVVHVLSEELDVLSRERGTVWVSYAISQGVVTALGSRVARALF